MAQKPKASTLTTIIEPAPQIASKGDCAGELSKYDWDYSQAYAIMMLESGNYPQNIFDNPATGDYSVGCFQINLIGEMRNTRPSEEWLLDPANNVQYAYQMYSEQGRSFCRTSGWYNSCKKAGL